MAIQAPTPTIRKHIQVTGIVQGVGFRPFVYNLAKSLDLTGWVFNSSSGVTIEIEGPRNLADRFLATLVEHPPPLAQIADVVVEDVPLHGEKDFSIHESLRREGEFVLVSPDVATCDDCWHDFGDRNNRRYGYPFTANRLYRASATQAGDPVLAAALDHLERALVEVANGPEDLSNADLARIQKEMNTDGLLFEVRVLRSRVQAQQQGGTARSKGVSI